MQKASKIIYIISIVMSALAFLGMLLVSLVCITTHDLIIEDIIETNAGAALSAELYILFLSVIFIASTCIFLVQLVVSAFALNSLSKNKTTIGIHVTAIVFGALGSIWLLLAGIFALVSINDQKKVANTANETVCL